MKKILFYSDSPTFGGHEIMFTNFVNQYLSNNSEKIYFITSVYNNKLNSIIDNIGSNKAKRYSIDFKASSFNGVFNFIRLRLLMRLNKTIKEINPDVIVLVQGMIELSSLPLLLPKKYEIISYIPQVLPMSENGAFLGSIRDFLNKFYYSRIDKIVTISEENKKVCISRWHLKSSKIHIVRNGIDTSHNSKNNKNTDSFRALCLGRFDLFCKRQDRLIVDFLSGFVGTKTELHIVGGGNETETKKLIKLSEPHSNVFISQWVDDSLSLIDTFDCLIVYSKFEGVPLVVLEAMSKGVAVISTELPYTKEFSKLDGFFILSDENKLCDVINHLAKLKRRYDLLKDEVNKNYSLSINSDLFFKCITHNE